MNIDRLWILLDLDDTLIEATAAQRAAWAQAFAEHGVSLSEAKLHAIAAGATSDRVLKTIAPHLPDDLAESIDKSFSQLEVDSHYSLMPRCEEFLYELRAAGHRLAVVTNSEHRKVELLRDRHPALMMIERWIHRECFVEPKPNPEPYIVALTTCACAAAEALAIEDSRTGLMAATAAGIEVICFRNDQVAAELRVPFIDVLSYTGLSTAVRRHRII